MNGITIIGIDCATQPDKVGLALGQLTAAGVRLSSAAVAGDEKNLYATLQTWLTDNRRPSLLALDAPLGWPAAMGSALAHHRAGSPLDGNADDLFRRETDRFVQQTLGLRPMDVGADRIARTARAALEMLQRLRHDSGLAIPLAWNLPLRETAAIEVYPAGTLAALGLPSRGYKGADPAARRRLLDRLSDRVEPGESRPALLASDHVFDAMLCVLAGADFLLGACRIPGDPELARREGWIWIRNSAPNRHGRTD